MAIFSPSSAEQIGIAITAGESFNLPCHLPPATHVHHPIRLPTLPPAVANVPLEHIRGYVHNKKVNNYLVGSNLGEGSFAKVKEAFHTLVGEKVAMKVIDKKKALQDPYVAKNFRREAKLLQMVRHQNILQLLEVIETDSSFYLITELCSGGELMKYIYKKGQLDEKETNKFMRQIVSAVDHLHRAGIIHRDLKVENMLLDANMDIKIIDFGLSNEEYVEGEAGLIHCTTQCGSPAYAAPELLGHKSYGPQVDIWSIGVNMYAMLTGCLPYTVEPFNITALHAKMLENKMNPIPDHLSASCKDLLKQLLRSNPDVRVKMPDIMKHSWMNEGHTLPFGHAQFPNKLEYSDVNLDILQHMVNHLKLKGSEDEMKQELVTNRSTNSAAIYHLLSARLARYNKQFQSRPVRVRHKSRVSQDQGYYEGEDEDDRSVASMPTRLTKYSSSRQSSRPTGGVVLRHPRPRPGGGKARIVSYPTVTNEEEMDEVDEQDAGPSSRYRSRRQTMPEMMLKEDIAKIRMKDGTSKSSKRPPSTRQSNPNPPSSSQRQRRESPPSKYAMQTTATLAPVRPPPVGRSQNAALTMIRDDLSKTLPNSQQQQSNPARGGGVMQAWHSNPPSRNPSRNPSRQGSRNHIKMLDSNDFSMPVEDGAGDCEGLEFHEVRSSTLPRSSSRKKSSSIVVDSAESIPDSVNGAHLPAITERQPIPSWHRQRNSSEPPQPRARKNGYLTGSQAADEIRTELGVEEVLTEVLRAARSLKIREVEKTSVFGVSCVWAGIKIEVTVDKMKLSSCKLYYRWISGGDLSSYQEKCDRLSKKIKTYVISYH